MTDYEKLKEVIQTANPDLIMKVANMGFVQLREIRLADVLIAIGGHQPIHFGWGDNGVGYFISNEDKLLASWNLKDDNLDHQTEETKQFLIDLLIK